MCVCELVRLSVCLCASVYVCTVTLSWLLNIFVKTRLTILFSVSVCLSICLSVFLFVCLFRWMPDQVVTDFEMALMVALRAVTFTFAKACGVRSRSLAWQVSIHVLHFSSIVYTQFAQLLDCLQNVTLQSKHVHIFIKMLFCFHLTNSLQMIRHYCSQLHTTVINTKYIC